MAEQTFTFTDGTAAASSATVLAAVNEILQSVGLPEVNALDTSGQSEEAEAEAILDQEDTRIQKRGWHANTLIDKTYSIDTSGHLVLGSSVLKANPVSGSRYLAEKVTMRDEKVYNLDDETFVWTDDMRLNVVSKVAFAQLPPALRDYIIKQAAVKFQRFKKRGRVDEQIMQNELLEARIAAEHEDGDAAERNMLDNAEHYNLRGRRRERSVYI